MGTLSPYGRNAQCQEAIISTHHQPSSSSSVCGDDSATTISPSPPPAQNICSSHFLIPRVRASPSQTHGFGLMIVDLDIFNEYLQISRYLSWMLWLIYKIQLIWWLHSKTNWPWCLNQASMSTHITQIGKIPLWQWKVDNFSLPDIFGLGLWAANLIIARLWRVLSRDEPGHCYRVVDMEGVRMTGRSSRTTRLDTDWRWRS